MNSPCLRFHNARMQYTYVSRKGECVMRKRQTVRQTPAAMEFAQPPADVPRKKRSVINARMQYTYVSRKGECVMRKRQTVRQTPAAMEFAQPPADVPRKKRSVIRNILLWTFEILVVILFAYVIVYYFGQSRTNVGQSMDVTLSAIFCFGRLRYLLLFCLHTLLYITLDSRARMSGSLWM